MAPQYGHSNHGVNIANYRLLAQSTQRKEAQNGYRTQAEWAQETAEHIGMGNTQHKLSSTLRHASGMLQVAAADQVQHDMTTVEEALKSKLNQTNSLRVALEACLIEVNNEIESCLTLRASLEERMHKVQSKLDLNNGRLQGAWDADAETTQRAQLQLQQVRSSRPTREKTMDDVERSLLNQHSLISSMIEKVKRGIMHLDKEVGHLETVKAKLEGDLRDKLEAIEVDTAVLAISPDGRGDTGHLRKKHDCILKTPHTWVRSTEDNIHDARHWLIDSQRLRKAVRHAMQNARMTEHELARLLNQSMLTKLSQTYHLKDDLEKQLARIRKEQAKAEGQRQSLAAALEAKRGPLQQAKERFNTRKSRPCREFVQDEVEAALTHEIAHLNAVTSQLSTKVNAVDKELAQLDLAAAMIEDNIHDKQEAISLDERTVLMDGRINVPSPPPSSIVSWGGSQMSTVRAATLKRIQELELELTTARREREALESTIHQLKESLHGPQSPSGPLSPHAFEH